MEICNLLPTIYKENGKKLGSSIPCHNATNGKKIVEEGLLLGWTVKRIEEMSFLW